MLLKYGDYEHEEGENTVAITRSPVYDRAYRRVRERETWQIRGQLLAASQAALKTAIEDLEEAYAEDGENLRLYHDGGGTVSAHALLAADCELGPLVTGPDYPEGGGAEYAILRSYEITVTGEKAVSAAEEIADYVETLSFSGGGARKRFSSPIEGAPQLYQTAAQTLYVVVQQGSAIGRTGYPTAPSPRFSGANINLPVYEINNRTPERVGDSYYNYEITWRYVMESATPMTGAPNPWLT